MIKQNVGGSPRPGYVVVVPWSMQHVGGVNQVVSNLCRETLAAGELQSIVMVSEWSAFRPVETMMDGCLTVSARLWSPWSEGGSIANLLKWMVASPLYLTQLLLFCRRHRVVAFNFQYPSLLAFPIALLRLLGLYRGALILAFQGLDLRGAQKAGRIERALWRILLDQATAVVGCSRALAAEVSEFVGKRASRVQAIHNGLDVDHFLSHHDRAAALPPILRDRDFILSVATFEHKKGLDVLLRAFAQLRSANPQLALALVGRSADAATDLRALADELGVAADVVFCEDVPHGQVSVFLECAKVFCLPSRSEPFGIAILEAGAYRLPVVASRVGGIPEIVIDGESGLLVEPEDSQALASAIDRVLVDKKLARDLGENLHRRVRAEFSWKRAYAQYRGLLPERAIGTMQDRRGAYFLALSWVPAPAAMGGVNQVVAGLYDAIRADGRVVPYILAARWDAFLPQEERDSSGRIMIGFRIRGLDVANAHGMGVARFLVTLPRDLWRLRNLIRRYRVAVVNCHYVGQSEITWAVAKKLGVYRGKLILSLHGRDGRTLATLGGVHGRVWRWTLRQADAVVACSRDLTLETMSAFALPATHVVTIHNGVDASKVVAVAEAGRPSPATPAGGPAVLNLGTFEHKKGHDVLLRAFKMVLECYPEAHLTIMGRQGETTEATTRLVAELGLGDRVSLHVNSPHEAALGALSATDLFVLSSRNEAFSIVLLEAGALAKPIVATDVCGVAELIEDGVTGIIVPPEDSDALASGMVRALGDRARAAERGRRLRNVVREKFTTTATGRAYLRLAGWD